jgi:hypothetical protein
MIALQVVPVSFEEAIEFVKDHHRHHDPPLSHKFSVAIADESGIRGVAIVGRPISRMASDGWTLEVLRCCTDGVPNGCSMLYRTCWRCAQAMGYRKLITYTMAEEGGTSLRATGFKCLGKAGGGSWSRDNRPRIDNHPLQTKMKWLLEM